MAFFSVLMGVGVIGATTLGREPPSLSLERHSHGNRRWDVLA